MPNTYPTIKGMSPLLLVSDLNASLAFYTQNLGFETAFTYEDFYAGIIKDGYSIHLKAGKPNAHERTDTVKNQDPDILFSVNGIEEHYLNIKNKGVAIIQDLREMPYGKEFYITDPDAYLLAFIEEK